MEFKFLQVAYLDSTQTCGVTLDLNPAPTQLTNPREIAFRGLIN